MKLVRDVFGDNAFYRWNADKNAHEREMFKGLYDSLMLVLADEKEEDHEVCVQLAAGGLGGKEGSWPISCQPANVNTPSQHLSLYAAHFGVV